MDQRLTERIVSDLAIRSERYEVWDAELDNFGVRVSPSGYKSYFVKCCLRGSRAQKRHTIGNADHVKLDTARRLGRVFLGRVAAGEDPDEPVKAQDERILFSRLANDFIEHYAKKRKRSWKDDERRVDKHLIPAWGGRASVSIQSGDVVDVFRSLHKTPVEANRVLSLASKIFNFARSDHRYGVLYNPASKLGIRNGETPKERSLTDEELKLVWMADVPQRNQDLARLLTLTIQRQIEVLSMRAQDIGEDRWWTIPSDVTKNKRAHRVWLSDPAFAIVERLLPLAGPAGHLFPSSRSKKGHWYEPQKALTLLRAKTPRVPHYTFHDLRRTGFTNLTRRRICDREMADRVVNHKIPGVGEQHYNKYQYEDERRDALTKWADAVLAIVGT